MIQPQKKYDVIIIGGGIVGAGILRDLAMHGINTLLAEKHDFGSQTSSKSSKMLHGGIRYLENLDFALVFEALHEKNLWLKLAPELATEECFYLPVFKDSKRPLWMLKLGLFLYDFLSGFQNTSHRIATKVETLNTLKGIKSSELKGAGVYYDAIVDDLRLTTKNIDDACKEGPVQAISHLEFVDFNRLDDNKIIVNFLKSGKIIQVECKDLIFATGPFTDIVLSKQSQLNWTPKLIPSKGSHLWLTPESLEIEAPLVITTKDDRVVFVIPHGDKILVGTTEENITSEYDFIKPSPNEIQYLIDCVNNYFPSSNICEQNIISSFAGIRPLVKEEGSGNNKSKTAREHKVFMPFSNMHIIVGGKLTTFRVMGQSITRLIVQKLGRSYNPDKTKRPLLKK